MWLLHVLLVIVMDSYSVLQTDWLTENEWHADQNCVLFFIIFLMMLIYILLVFIVLIAVVIVISDIYHILKKVFRFLRLFDGWNEYKVDANDVETYKENDQKCKPTGLKNTKQTCYMNAIIQAMASSTVYNKQLSELVQLFPACNSLRLFVDTFEAINNQSRRIFSVNECTERLLSFLEYIQWNRSDEQDAFELFSFCIEAIQRDIGLENAVIPPKLSILHTFTENPEYNNVQDHLALAVPLCGSFTKTPGVPLEVLLDAVFKPSVIDDGPHETSMCVNDMIPEVLILHIQANEWDCDLGKYIKPTYYIHYGDTLKYTFRNQKDRLGADWNNTTVEYELVAVVHHMGNISDGHYITYRKYEQQWYLTNDEQVRKVTFKCDIVPYIMVYDILR